MKLLSIVFILVFSFSVFGQQTGDNPAREFLDGKINKFSTKNHPKAKGLSFEIRVPASWTNREGNRPNIIQFFKSSVPNTNSAMTLMVKDIPIPKGLKLTKKDIASMFTPSALKDFISEGSTFIEGKSIVLEGQQGGMVVYDTTNQRLEVKIKSRGISYFLFYNNKLIALQFIVGGVDDGNMDTVQEFNRMKPLFNLIANTLIISDKYK